jgi:hypothetical protein
MSAQEGRSDAANKTSVESTAQDKAFQEVKIRKRHISNNTSQTIKKSTKPFPGSAAVKMPQKGVLTRNFFATVSTSDMNTETTGAANTLLEQEAPRKPGRPSLIMVTLPQVSFD